MDITTKSTSVDTADSEWRARPWLARLARVAILGTPFVAVTAGAWKLNDLLGQPATFLEAVARWAALSLVSTLALITIDRGARQYLPLPALLHLSIVFPDQAPSRFKMALRRGTAKQLAQEVADLENATAQEAAEHLLLVVGQLTAHDRLTRGHTERVRAYADLVAVEMDLSETERMKLQWAGLLHDVGKLAVPAEVLNKSEKLSDREWARLKTHPAEGWKMVQPMRAWLGEWARGTRDHHERWDGGGYPRGAQGHEISRAGRIIAVVDAFDVMTSVRSYKKAMPHDAARSELASCSGSHFDPDVVRAFLSASLVPKQRGKFGAWLANFPIAQQFGQAAQVPAAVTSAMAAMVAAATVVVPTLEAETPDFSAERIVIEEEAAGDPASSLIGDRATTTTSTTTTTSRPDGDSTTTSPAFFTPPDPTFLPAAPTVTTSAPPTTTTPTSTTTTPSGGVAGVTTTLPVTTTTTSTATTTSTSTTTTTTTTTTTVPVSLFAGGYLGGGSGDSFGLASSVGGTGATNWDSGANADPGYTVTSGPSGLIELDAGNVITWRRPVAEDTRLAGAASLRAYVAAPGFDTTVSGAVAAGISDCERVFAGCTTIAAGQISYSQSGFGSDFGLITIDFGYIDHIVPDGHNIVVSMTAPQSAGTDSWLAFGTADYPSQLRLL